MKNPTHYFTLESKPNKSGNNLIYFHLAYGYKEFNLKDNKESYIHLKISTQWTIAQQYWTGKPIYRANQIYVRKKGKDINNQLERIEKEAYNQLSLYRNEYEKNPIPKELKRLVLEKLNRINKKSTDVFLTDYISNLIDKKTKLPKASKEHWGTRTKIGYENLKNHILKYESHKNTKLSLGLMTEDVYWDYFETLNNIIKQETGNYYIQTTMAKECKNLKAIFNCAIDDDIKIGFNFSKKRLKIHPSESMYETYLTEQQLIKIIESNVTHSTELQRGKEYIILSSFTGLRIGDMKYLHQIKPEKIKYDSKTYRVITTKIRKSQDNTKELIVSIPILQPVKQLLKNNSFPMFTSEPNIRKCVRKLMKHLDFNEEILVNYNYYLSDVVITKKKKQHQLFSPHDCRTTYITNLKQLGIHNDTIEPITHPKVNYASVLDSYDKSSLTDKAIKLINAINSKKSKIFKY